MAKTLSIHGHSDGYTTHQNIVRLSQDVARLILASQTALTDSSGGAADNAAPYSVKGAGSNLTDVAIDNDGADKTTLEAALTKARSACRTIIEKAKTMAAVIGIPHSQITDNSGGTNGNGTVASMDAATGAAAATAPTAESVNAVFASLDNHLFVAAALVNKLCVATGTPKLSIEIANPGAWPPNDTVAAYAITVSAAGANGVKKTDVDAKLAQLRNDVATIAARLNAVRGGISAGNNQLVVVE